MRDIRVGDLVKYSNLVVKVTGIPHYGGFTGVVIKAPLMPGGLAVGDTDQDWDASIFTVIPNWPAFYEKFQKR